jgi:two-component system KDP operon response regulator KdpE
MDPRPSPAGPPAETPRCLIVTEDRYLGRLIDLLLDHGEYIRKAMSDAREAERTIDQWHPHVAILDIDIDGGRGVDLVDRWKDRGIRLPIIGVTRRNTIQARLGAFERGIDDLLVVPFAPEELVARAIGVMRRVHGVEVAFIPEIAVGRLEIDLLHQRLRADGHELELTPIEKALLYILAANAGETMTRDQLLDYIWGYDRDVGSNLIDRHVADLRAKLGDDRREPRFIETRPGAGYRYVGRA